MSGAADQLDPLEHNRIFRENVLPASEISSLISHDRPVAIILGGQPGSGKGVLERAARAELNGDVATVDPDALRDFHPRTKEFRAAEPYTWSDRTHQDASAWANELRQAAVDGRKNIIIDATLGDGGKASKLIESLRSRGYDVEVRAVAAHRLESETGVDRRFSQLLDQDGYGRYVPREVRDRVYKDLPNSLDTIHEQTGVRIRIFGREGKELYDSRIDARPPGEALEAARDARLSDPKIVRNLDRTWQQQREWHAKLPEALPHNPNVSPETAENLLTQRSKLGVVEGVERDATTIAEAASAARTGSIVVKGVGVVGVGAMAVDAYRTAKEYEALSTKSNQFGADALLHQYEGRTAGGLLGGGAAGFGYGLVTGSETGPGALVTGAVGGVIGAFGGEKLATLYNTHQINHQKGPDGRTYAHADGQWTSSEYHIDWHHYASGALPGIVGSTTPAPADQLSSLDYKRATAVTELALANPQTQDTRNINLAGTDWHASHGTWTREVPVVMAGLPQVDDFGRPITTPEAADKTTGSSLGRIAANRQYNNDHYAQTVAQAYVMDYYGKGWNRSGTLPDAIGAELKRPGENQIKDPATGHTWTADGKGGFTRGEVVVGYDAAITVPVHAAGDEQTRLARLQRDAINSNAAYGTRLIEDAYALQRRTAPPASGQHPSATHPDAEPATAETRTQSARAASLAHIATAMHNGDIAALHGAAEPFTNSVQGRALLKRSAAEAQHEPHRPPPTNPDQALTETIRKQTETLYTRAGIYPTQTRIDHVSAALALQAREHGMTNVDRLQFNADRTAITATDAGRNPFNRHATVDIARAMQLSPQHAFERMADLSQAAAAAQQQASRPGVALTR